LFNCGVTHVISVLSLSPPCEIHEISVPEKLDSSDWKNLKKKPEPDGTETIDSTKGWIQSLSVHGVTFKADHYTIVENPLGFPRGSIKVVMWNNDPQERTPEETYAREWIFQPMKLKNNKWYPPQNQIVYISEIMKQDWEGRGILPLFTGRKQVTVKPYEDFITPEDSLIRHGVWVSEKLNLEYEKEELHNYRESV